jgi:hypothetical protein
MAKQNTTTAVKILQLTVGIFLILSGILGIMEYNSTGNELFRGITKAFGQEPDVTMLIIPIIELAAGVFVIGLLVITTGGKWITYGIFAVLGLWAVRLIYYYIAHNFLEPDFIVWLYQLFPELIILASLWLVSRRYTR